MKKTLTIISLAAATILAQAQGFVEFYGGAASIQTNTAVSTFFGGTGSGGSSGKMVANTGGQSYVFELLYATTAVNGNSAPTNSAWSPVLAFGGGALGLATNGIGPGDLYGPGSSGGVGTALTAGTTYSVELVGWSSNLGNLGNVLSIISSGGSATAGYLGWTSIGTITPFATIGAGDPTIFPTTYANGTLSLFATPTISVTPEPGTMVLAGLGGLSLLALRRKK